MAPSKFSIPSLWGSIVDFSYIVEVSYLVELSYLLKHQRAGEYDQDKKIQEEEEDENVFEKLDGQIRDIRVSISIVLQTGVNFFAMRFDSAQASAFNPIVKSQKVSRLN